MILAFHNFRICIVNVHCANSLSMLLFLGTVGDWKNHYSEDLSKMADQLYEQNLGGSGLTHEFE